MNAKQTAETALLNALPQPALLLKSGKVLALNPPAKLLFPRLLPGNGVPPVFPAELTAGKTGQIALLGYHYNIQVSAAASEKLLLTLSPAPLSGPLTVPERWNALTEQLRLQLSDLTVASQTLSPVLTEGEDPAADRAMELLERTLYRTLRLTRHLELALQPDMDYRPAVFDLAGFCSQFCGQAAPLLKEAQVALRYDSDLVTLPVHGDRQLLQFVLLTLLSNGVKAAGKGGHVSLSLSRAGTFAVLRMEDSGDGLPPAALAGLFDAQAALPPSPGKGMGLGLYLARKAVSLHGGGMIAESRPGHGLCLVISLPLKPGGALPLATPLPDRQGGFSPLLVELSDALPASAFSPLDVE